MAKTSGTYFLDRAETLAEQWSRQPSAHRSDKAALRDWLDLTTGGELDGVKLDLLADSVARRTRNL